MQTQPITPETDPKAAKEYDFRVNFLGCPIFDMSLDDRGYENLGEGEQFAEGLKDIAFSIFNSRVSHADRGLPLTKDDDDTLVLLEIVKQKFRKGISEGNVLPGETARTYFRRNLEIRFLQ